MNRFLFFFFIAILGLIAPPVHAATYATWSSSNCGGNFLLSNGNLTAQHIGGGWASCFGTVGKSSGKWFWEYSSVDNSITQSMVGFSGTRDVNTYIGSLSDGYGYFNEDGQIYNKVNPYGATFTSGDVIGVALDLDNDTVEFFKNGVSQGTASIVGGTYYPAISLNTYGSITANFGASSFSYSVPTGYNAGLCSESSCEGGSSSSTPNLLNFDLHSKNGTLSTFFSEYQNLIISCGALLLLVAVNFVIYSLVMAMVSFRKKML